MTENRLGDYLDHMRQAVCGIRFRQHYLNF